MAETNEKNEKNEKKSIISWALYDWANSAFATTVMAGFFPLFFANYWCNGDTNLSTFWLGLGNSIASIVVAAMAPFLGAISDRMSGKKKFLFFFCYLGLIMTGSLWMLGAGMYIFAIAFFIVATIGFSGANLFYDALLVGVASEEKRDYVSSLGFSLGYIGGGVLFVVNVLMFLMPTMFGLPDEPPLQPTAIKLSFLSVAIWWLVFSIPIFVFVKEPEAEKDMTFKRAIKEGLSELKETVEEAKKLKYVALFLIGYWFYIDGVDTIIKMAVDYGNALGFGSSDLIVALLITQFVAFPMTLVYFKFSEKIGTKNGVLVAVMAYIIITIIGYFMEDVIMFYILAMIVGCFQGGIQALSRSLYSRLIPDSRAGQFYGFFNMLGKFATIIGPFLMAIITKATGNQRLAILSIIFLFLIGGLILLKVNFEEGERMSKEFDQRLLNAQSDATQQ